MVRGLVRATVCGVAATLVGGGGATAVAQDKAASYVWWEAENPAAGNFDQNPKDNPRVQEVMSGGTWIGVNDPHPAGQMFLEYKVNVPAAGEYEFLARKFWHHGPFRWRFDDQPWQQVDNKKPLLDGVELWTHWGANWVPAGFVTLDAGEHTLRIELTKNDGVAYFDAFILTRGPFTARGKLKPDAPYPAPPAGWFTFAPGFDDFSPAALDLRSLNEKVAGQNGFVKADGERLLLGDGTPARFWAVNLGPEATNMPRPYVDRLVKSLAKRGVNLVRLHGALFQQSGPSAGEVDRVYLDNLQYIVAAMGREGIYTTLSIYFPLWIDLSQHPKFEGYKAGQRPFAIHMFDPAFIDMHRGWFRAMLTTPNPHDDGRPLAKNPAVATVEIVNEDSFFFWTFKNDALPEKYLRQLETRFGQWLTKRHGSIDKAIAAWGGRRHDRDAAGEGRVGFISLHEIFNQRDARSQDTTRFLAELQRDYYADATKFLKQDLGYGGLITGSNWTTASPRYLHHVDHWTNLVADVMDHHGYFDNGRKKVAESFQPGVGDAFGNRALVRLDPANPEKPERRFDFPFLDYVFAGKPSMVSEQASVSPNRWRGEWPVLTAVLSAQAGIDVQIHFAIGGSSPWLSKSQSYWPAATPTDLGQYPAAALIYRTGIVPESEPLATVNVNVDDMLALKGSPTIGGSLQDFVRTAGVPEQRAEGGEQLNPALMAAGKVVVDIGDKPSGVTVSPKVRDLVDADKGVVRGATGAFVWRTDPGLFQLTDPQAQGATGFLAAAGEIESADLRVSSKMEFGTVVAVALDGKPLAESGRILVQVMSEQSDQGWVQEGEPLGEIKSLGGPPIVVRQFDATVAFKRPDAKSLTVTALDWNGRPTKPVGDAASFRVLPDAAYYLVAATR